MIDVDHFKAVNDTHGHAVGDTVLKEIVAVMRSNVRNVDLVARLGGEEFVIVMPDTHAQFAAMVADRLREKISSTMIPLKDGDELSVTVSIGCAVREPDDTAEQLLDLADKALYQGKEAGRNRRYVRTRKRGCSRSLSYDPVARRSGQLRNTPTKKAVIRRPYSHPGSVRPVT